MKEIMTFDELFEIQDEKYKDAISGDLMFTRYGMRIIDGFVFLIGADSKYSLELFYMSFDVYNKLTDGEKEYIARHYGVN